MYHKTMLQEQAVRMIQDMSDEKMRAFKELVATRYEAKNICRMTLIRMQSWKPQERKDMVVLCIKLIVHKRRTVMSQDV